MISSGHGSENIVPGESDGPVFEHGTFSPPSQRTEIEQQKQERGGRGGSTPSQYLKQKLKRLEQERMDEGPN